MKKNETMNTMDGIIPKQLLKEGFYEENIEKFEEAIRLGAHLDQPFEDDESEETVYELVLSTFGYSKFVKACINAGCNVNYKNLKLGKAAINYAVASRDYRTVLILLNYNPIPDIDYICDGETVLNTLVKDLEEKNSNDVACCIKTLLSYEASPNLRDREGLTPLENLLKNQKVSTQFRCELVTQFLKKQNLELPLYRSGLDYLLSNSKDLFASYWTTNYQPTGVELVWRKGQKNFQLSLHFQTWHTCVTLVNDMNMTE